MKIIYKIVNSIAALLIIPALIFLPMFRFIMVVGMNSSNQILSLLGGMFDINEIIKNASGIDLEHLPEFYTLKSAYEMFFGESAKIDAAGFDTSALPDALVKFFTAAGVLFVLALVCALVVLILGLFTKKRILTASFSALGFVFAFSAGKCFNHIAEQLVSGKMPLTQLISGMEALQNYKSYLDYINLDIRIFELGSAYTAVLVILGLIVLFNIGVHLAEGVGVK